MMHERIHGSDMDSASVTRNLKHNGGIKHPTTKREGGN